MRKFKLIVVCAMAFLFLSSCGPRPLSPMENMMLQVPEAIEMFEQSREYLEVLRTSGFAERELSAHVFHDGLGIAFGTTAGGGGVHYDEWYTLEWLSEQERNALVFLLTSEELSWNFVWIESTRETGSIVATLYYRAAPRRGDFIEIWHGEADNLGFGTRIGPMRESYSRGLGDGWVLWVYTVR